MLKFVLFTIAGLGTVFMLTVAVGELNDGNSEVTGSILATMVVALFWAAAFTINDQRVQLESLTQPDTLVQDTLP